MNPRIMALSFTALMLTSVLPASSATHTNDILGQPIPDTPVLPHVEPTQNCAPVGVDQQILVRVNQALAGNPAFYQDDIGVPQLCVNGPVSQWEAFINQADNILDNLRNASREVQRQVDYRLESTLPDSGYPNDLIEPRTVLLNETFNGFRTGGFGEWTVVTEEGEDPVWRLTSTQTVNGTRNAYRFGDDDGYVRGAHQFLVSPEIDLTSLKGNQSAVASLVFMREQARQELRFACNEFAVPQSQPYGSGQLAVICGEGTYFDAAPLVPAVNVTAHALVLAYEQAFRDTVDQLPVMQHGAFMDLTYRMSLAPGEDGVRLWLYVGDRAPDRRVLFNESLGIRPPNEQTACQHYAGQSVNQVYPALNDSIGTVNDQGGTLSIVPTAECYSTWDDGFVVPGFNPFAPGDEYLPDIDRTIVTADSDHVHRNWAFTGDVAEFKTARWNLTPWLDQRVWVLFEVITRPNDRGDDIFSDTGRFPRQRDYGFELSRLYVEGDGYLRNFRVKDVAATYPYQIAGNAFNDSTDVRTTMPPGNAPVVTWVHNAGDYLENGTVRLSARAKLGSATEGSWTTLGSTDVKVSLVPDEVKTLTTLWSKLLTPSHPTLKENWVYEVTADLVSNESNATSVPAIVNQPNSTLDPNVTRVRPPNAAGLPELVGGVGGAGELQVTSLVRSASLRDVVLLRADGTTGNPIEICSSVKERKCEGPSPGSTGHYAGRKGEPRIVLVGVRNDGNAAQNISVELKVELDGADKPDIILNGPVRVARDVLPGEVRAIEWTVIPTQPGAYRVVAVPIAEVPAGAKPPTLRNAERLMYVQRSTGIICLDSFDQRECVASFTGGFVPELRLENITAATLTPDGSLLVATEVREAEAGVHSGQLAIRDASGWRVLKNLSATLLNTTFNAPPAPERAYGSIRSIVVSPTTGAIYLTGDNSTALRVDPNGQMTRIALHETPGVPADPTDLAAAAWHKGTLVVAGSNGTLAALNTSGALERFAVQNTSYQNISGTMTAVASRYTGNLTSLVVTANDEAIAAGEGVILRHAASNGMAAGWTEAKTASGRLFSDVFGNGTRVHALGLHAGRVLAMGEGFILASTKDTTNGFGNLTLPPPSPPNARPIYLDAMTLANGELLVLDSLHNVVTCEPTSATKRGCYDADPAWSYSIPVRPTVLGKGAQHPAGLSLALADDVHAYLLGEAGLVLERLTNALHENELDWTVVSSLAPRDGGVLQTRRGDGSGGNPLTKKEQAIVLIPDDRERGVAQGAEKFRVFLNHSMNWTETRDATAAIDSLSFAQMNVIYRPVPAQSSGVDNDNRQSTCPYETTDNDPTAPLSLVCYNEAVRYSPDDARFLFPTQTDGWESRVWTDIPAQGPVPNPLGANDPVGTWFYGLEIQSTPGIRYAIDDVLVQGYSGGAWKDVAAWYGPNSPKNKGAWFLETIYEIANHTNEIPNEAFPVPILASRDTYALLNSNALGVAPTQTEWEEWAGAPFDLAGTSPWHLTTQYADRPVFAANNEFYKEGFSEPSAPRLLSNWDARLVSPIIDLQNAYDPVVEWRHTYAFRTYEDVRSTAPGVPTCPGALPGECTGVVAADGGFVEIQYERRGAECGSTDITVTCGWSQWYPVTPEGDYPNFVDLRYPIGDPLVKYDATAALGSDASHPTQGRLGLLGPGDGLGGSLSYWGRVAKPDATGRIETPRLTESYETQQVWLANVTCSEQDLDNMAANRALRLDCIPTNVTGTKIRVAFHLQTAGKYVHSGVDGYASENGRFNHSDKYSFPGEGWYITDFKVLGARKLGIDLAAQNLSFRVGYDVETIGVGPGTKVPVNVTVKNNGAFDALGYTGRLEVRRVLDRALKLTELVDTIPLTQQPLLQVDDSVNHTLIWSVPPTENAEYALTFVLTPIGIDRDEDHLDNTIVLGTTSDPVPARTVRRFNPEILVSPQNATSDITRYVPMFLNNTGNVPLSGFTVERRIIATGRTVDDDARTCEEWQRRVALGQPTAIVDCRIWHTQREAPPGALSPLALLSDEVSPTTDLFWKAPESTTFKIILAADTQVGSEILAAAVDKPIASFATYLFDDVEGGIRGESRTGGWTFGSDWNGTTPGFRSTDAYGFGDIARDRYPDDADAALDSPTVDLGSARTAQLAFYHNYAFEPGFDGGIVEASADGGKTWSSLTPLRDALSSVSYNLSFDIQPTTSIHPNGDPETKAWAFTHDSTQLPSNVGGWVLSQIDLTDYANITEPDVEYEAYHAAELGRYGVPAPIPTVGKNLYYAPDWCAGSFLDGRCWSSENLTQGTLVPVASKAPGETENTMWWSGSGSLADDGLRPVMNHMIEFEVDMSSVRPDQTVIADWWEYSDRFFTLGHTIDTASCDLASLPHCGNLYTAQTFTTRLSPPETWRYNLGEAKIVESRGRWYHMQSDITGLIPRLDANGTRTLEVGFSYAPVTKYSTFYNDDKVITPETGETLDILMKAPHANGGNEYSPRLADDRGFAIDGFKIEAFRSSGGARQSNPVVLINEAQAWEKISTGQGGHIWECGIGAYDNPAQPTGWSSASASNYPACFDGLNDSIEREPQGISRQVGLIWSAVASVPGVDSPWQVVSVQDHDGFGTDPLDLQPTGDMPKAWYTGDLGCDHLPTSEAPIPPSAEDGWRGDPRNEERCPRSGSEARLISPVFDLAKIAGDNAQLSFWHRFAFHQRNSSDTPLASGGVVEISVLDAVSGKWSPWKQIYSTDDMRVGQSLAPVRDGTRGGYTGFTANVSETSSGVRRYDPPFENVIPDDRETPVQFLYTGNSRSIEGASSDGWLREEFDVTKHLGSKVRFGFHYQYSPFQLTSQSTFALTDPDGPMKPGDRTGWWISDIALIGDVLVGQPVELRFRAGTDGNVHDGHWMLDDIGVFGARYKNNVGIFVDQTPGAFGAYNNTVTEVPVTIRNLGDSVRRDLALEVRVVGTGVTVSGAGPGGNETLDDKAFVLKGFTLGPGQSATTKLKVHTPKNFGQPHATLVMQLKEANLQSTTTPYGVITSNEVQGVLSRTIQFTLQNEVNLTIENAGIREVSPALDKPVDLTITARNPGFGKIKVDLTCTARTIGEWLDVNHRSSGLVENPEVVATYPCTIEGKTELAAKEWTNLTFRATPTKAGFLQFKVSANVSGGQMTKKEIAPVVAGLPVGVPVAAYRETFDRKDAVLNNFSGSLPGVLGWSHVRGHDALGALFIGINESEPAIPGQDYVAKCGAAPCYAITQPIDLHNYTSSTPAFLSFWHMDRFARYDGAQVRIQRLEDELKPNQADSWSDWCILRPDGDYEGKIRHQETAAAQGPTQPPPGDESTAYGERPYSQPPPAQGEWTESPKDFFVSPGGTWEETWSLATFPIPKDCPSTANATRKVPLLGQTVRIKFVVYPGTLQPPSPERRAGEGWLLDEITVSPLSLHVRPTQGQRAGILDNTTKGFNVVLKNNGSMPDIIGLYYDAGNSSAPEGSVRVPTELYTLQPGETRKVRIDVTLPRDPSLLPADFAVRILAKSVRDPNAAGSTVLDLTFGPRQWAELGLVVEAPTGIVQEATETFIPVTVENNGLVDSIATRVRIVDTWPGGRIEHTLDLPSMPSYAQAPDEAQRILEFRWKPEKGAVGLHTLSFEIDPEHLGEEYTRANNLVTITVDVSDLLIPDLHVANLSALSLRNAVGGTVSVALDADVARYEVTAGEVVTLELKVANKGRAGATNVDVRPFVGALSLPPKIIPYIAPGTEAVATFNWLAQKGEHEIEFLVRSEQIELTTANNRYPGRGVTILTVKGYEIGVEIPAIEGVLAPESETRVPFRITNNGNAGEDLVLVAKSPSGTRISLPREGFFLRAGETYEDSARLILDAEAVAGEQFITINAVARENPMKVASGRAAMRVLASYGGSIAGGFATGSPPELVIPVELVNEGNSLEPWKLILSLPAGWTAKEAMPAKVVVPAHDRVIVQFHVSVPAGTAPGDRVLAVKAEMPNGEKREGVARVSVMPLRAAAVTLDNAAPRPERGELTMPVVVQNTGNVRQPFTVLLVDPPAGVEMRIEPSEFLLPPGGEALATLIVKPNDSIEAGTYAIQGYTRFEGVVPNTREGLANVQTLRVPIVRQEIKLTSLEFTPRAELDAGDRVTVKAFVQNFGSFEVANVPVHLFVDDVFVGEAIVPTLAPGVRVDVTFNWTAVNGVHTLTAVADPYEDTVDADREDNAVSALATVGIDAPAGGIAAGRADAPMGGAALVVLSLIAAVFVTRTFGSWRRERR